MRGIRLFLAALTLITAATGARAAELVMFESETCFWCDRWDAEIGGTYPRTAEGRAAPLRRVDLYMPRPDDLKGIRGVVYTPTFVLVDNGREVGRLVGYPGEDFFWPMLGQMLSKISRQY